jgi:hypothetical protein
MVAAIYRRIADDNRKKAISSSRPIKYMQMILNKKEKEKLVVKLHQENKTIRQEAH